MELNKLNYIIRGAIMQFKKEHIKKTIIESARDEFIKKGYFETSIRDIASIAGVSKSNIYNYFENKNKLFVEVLHPMLNQMEIAKKHFIKNKLDVNIYDFEIHMKIMEGIRLFIEEYRDLISLLVFRAHGSELENYMDDLIDWFTNKLSYKFSDRGDSQKNSISWFIAHNIAGIWYNFLREVIMHDIKGEELERSLYKIMTFVYNGVKGMVDNK